MNRPSDYLTEEQMLAGLDRMERQIRDNLHTMTLEQRARGAEIWAHEIGNRSNDFIDDEGQHRGNTTADLIVRCFEEYRGHPCGQRLARVWSTPFGHYAETRCAPGHERNMQWLSVAMDERQKGNANNATEAEAAADRPVIVPCFLEFFPPEFEFPMACPRRHGDILVEVSQLIRDADSTRRTMNVHPRQWRDGLE